MIKVIAVDIGGVCFEWDYERYSKEISNVSGLDKSVVMKILGKKIRDLHVKRISEKDYWNYFCKSSGKKIDHKVFRKITLGQYRPNRPVMTLIKSLKKRYMIALLANQTPILDEIDRKYNLYKSFDFNLSSHIVKMQKPYKNIYKLLIKVSKCKPEEILFIDDKDRNLKPAKKLGMKNHSFQERSTIEERHERNRNSSIGQKAIKTPSYKLNW